jgi:hypothetical protein
MVTYSKNQAALPQFLKRQFELGINLSESVDSISDFVDAASKCLNRDLMDRVRSHRFTQLGSKRFQA